MAKITHRISEAMTWVCTPGSNGFESDLTAMSDGSLSLTLDIPLPEDLPSGSFAPNSNPLRARLTKATEVRSNGATRALFKVSVKQDTTETTDGTACCCGKRAGVPEDDEYSAHIVVTIPPRIAKMMKRQIAQGYPYPLQKAIELLRSWAGYGQGSGNDVVVAEATAAAGGQIATAPASYVPVPATYVEE